MTFGLAFVLLNMSIQRQLMHFAVRQYGPRVVGTCTFLVRTTNSLSLTRQKMTPLT